MLRFLTAFTFVVALGAGQANAAPGSYFIVEGQAGYALGSAFAETPDGFGSKITLGVGGKPKGWPTRFYLIGNLTFADYTGALHTSLQDAETSRSWFAWSLGVRTMAPIARNLRVFADVSLGAASVDSDVTLNRRERYHATDGGFIVELGIGLQYRFTYHFSLGTRVDLAFPTGFDDFDLVSELAGGSSGDGGVVNPSFLVTATLHL